MIGYTQQCPYCGAENRNLLLEDSDGWMECSRCLRLTRFQGVWRKSTESNSPGSVFPDKSAQKIERAS